MKDLLKILDAEVIERGDINHGIVLLMAEDAVNLLKRGRREGWKILGFDGFKIVDNGIIPLQEYSVDFTDGIYSGGDEYEYGVNFINSRKYFNIYFEIVFED